MANTTFPLPLAAALALLAGPWTSGCDDDLIQCYETSECAADEMCIANACHRVDCEPDHHVENGHCMPCDPGWTRPPGDDPYDGNTECEPLLCRDGEHVVAHECEECPRGSTREAGDDASGDDTRCEPVQCESDYHVQNHLCVPCERDETNAAGDDASGDDTLCDAELCASNHHVSDGRCTPCAAGESRPAGDDPALGNTDCEPWICHEDDHVIDHACVSCPDGTYRPAGDDATSVDTECLAVICGANEHVVDHFCEPCPTGTTVAAGDDASGADTDCEPTICAEDERVLSHECVGCEPGSNRPAGDDASDEDTACTPTICDDNERVAAHACVPCDQGAVRAGGDLATGSDTRCEIPYCAADEHVMDHRCEPCAAGASNSAGDDPTGPDTPCDASACASNQHVEDHACVPCAQGTSREAGDDPAGEDTVCEDVICRSNQHVDQHVCVSCAPGMSNEPGDTAAGADTSCDAILCGVDQHAVGHTCEGCPPGTSNEPGDDASGDDTACDALLCGSNQYVSEHSCVACPPGSTNEPGDDASGPSSLCDPTLCGEDQRVLDHECAPCDPGHFNVAGDDASGDDTTCYDTCFMAVGVDCETFDEAYIKASNTGGGDQFGFSVAIDGDTLVVGAPYEDSAARGVNGDQHDNSAEDSGAVYVFRRSGNVWWQEAYLKASNADAGDLFGLAVSISGDVVAVGAPSEDGTNADDALPDNNDAAGSGAVYVFSRSGTSWSQIGYLKSDNSDARDQFGAAVDIEGTTLVVGAPRESGDDTSPDSNDALNAGAAYVFELVGHDWTQTAYLKASNPDEGDLFGNAVAVAGDIVVVGAHLEDSMATGVNGDGSDNSSPQSGAAYVFHRADAIWTQHAYLKPAFARPSFFGSAVDVRDQQVVIGAWADDNAATGVTEEWQPVAGASGAVYVFEYEAGGWEHAAYIKPSNTRPSSGFGYSLSLGDNALAVGAPFADFSGTGFNTEPGDAEDTGAVYLFSRQEGWPELGMLLSSAPDSADQFGLRVALGGGRLAVGATAESSSALGINGDSLDNNADESGAVSLRSIAP